MVGIGRDYGRGSIELEVLWCTIFHAKIVRRYFWGNGVL